MRILLFTLWLIGCTCSQVYASCIGIGCSCNINTVSTVAFGTYNPISGSALNGTGGFSITCSALVAGLNVSYVMALNAGLNGTFAARKMKFSSTLLSYNLYTTTGRTVVWGDGTAGTSTVSDAYLLSLLSNTRPYTVYGLIPASQNVIVGSYSDTITITLTF